MPLQTAEFVVRMGAIYLGLKLLGRLQGDSFDPSLTTFALFAAGIVWSLHLWRRLMPLIAERPYRGTQLFAAGVALPGNVVLGLLGYTHLLRPGSWILFGVVSAVAGLFLGVMAANEARGETAENDPGPDDGLDDEREVLIPLEAHFWKP